MLEVREIGPEATQQPRERDGHAQLLGARGQVDRLDALGDEVGTAGDGGEPEVGSGGGKLPEEVRHVRLVAGALAAEDVGVDQDHRASAEPPAHATSS